MKSKNTNKTSEVEVAVCDSPARLCKSCKTHKPRAKRNPSICLAGQELIMPLQLIPKKTAIFYRIWLIP
jgi:hypothetical protein